MYVVHILTQSTQVRIRLLVNFFSLFSNFKSHQKSIYFNTNEGNNQKFENKVMGRVRVGVERALLSQ